MFRSLLASVSIAAFAAVCCFAETPAPSAAPIIPTAPQVGARAYIVVDYRTDKILAAKDAVARMEPASLTKLMTAYIVFQELAAGKLKLNDQLMVSEHAWRSEGSRSFIELGKLENIVASLSRIAEIVYLEDVREKMPLLSKVTAVVGERLPSLVTSGGGSDKPAAAFQTLVWAALKGDDKVMAQTIGVDEASRSQVLDLMAAHALSWRRRPRPSRGPASSAPRIAPTSVPPAFAARSASEQKRSPNREGKRPIVSSRPTMGCH